MITYYKKTVKENDLRELKEFETGCWINVIKPSEEEINFLSEKFSLNKENLISGTDPNEIPRAEFIDNKTYLILKTGSQKEKYKLNTILIILSERSILTISPENYNLDELYKEGTFKSPTTQRRKFLLELFSYINEKFENITSGVMRNVNVEKENIGKLTEKQIGFLLDLEDLLNETISYFSYISLVYNKVVKKINFYEEDKELIDDLIIDTEQKLNLCKLSLKSISNIRNKMMILSSNKLNKLITILTIFTVMISIPAAIFGLYGMNISLPFNSQKNILYYILLFILLIWMLFIAYLKRKKLL